MYFKKHVEELLSLIYPKICFGCKKVLKHQSHIYLCSDCWSKLNHRITPPFCTICGRPIDILDLDLSNGDFGEQTLAKSDKSTPTEVADAPKLACAPSRSLLAKGGTEVDKCPDCTGYQYYFRRGYTAALYEGLTKDCIHSFKYNSNTYLAGTLAQLMIDFSLRYMDLGKTDALVPVPLHWRKLRQRGFNQAELLTKKISAGLGIPGIDGLRRIRYVPSQTELPREERLNNVKGTFRVIRPENFTGKRILLIDDVFTTGATLNECSRVIMEVGAKEVWVFSLARGI